MSTALEVGKGKALTHVAGCYVINADASFLNGGGKGESKAGFDNYTVIKSFMDGRSPGGAVYYVAYVSGQAVRYWVRTTIIKMTGWPPSLKRALGLNPKSNPEKSGTARDPIKYAEDDLMGYMDTMSKDMKAILKLNEKIQAGEFTLPQDGNITAKEIAKLNIDVSQEVEEAEEEGEEDEEEALTAAAESKPKTKSATSTQGDNDSVRGFFRTSPVSMSPLIGLRNSAWEGIDKAYVHLADGSIPYETQFSNSAMSGIFVLDFDRVGVFEEAGDKSELNPEMRDNYLANGQLVEDFEHRQEFYSAEANPTIQAIADYIESEKEKAKKKKGKSTSSSSKKETKKYYIPVQKFGRTFKLADLLRIRYERSTAFIMAMAKLEGGARQSVYCTDVSPKCLVLAGTTNGIPILNSIFEDYTLEGARGKNVKLKISTLKDIIIDHAEDIVTPVIIGTLSDYLVNDYEVKQLNHQIINGVQIIVTTPVQAAKIMCSLLPGAEKYGRKEKPSTEEITAPTTTVSTTE